MIQENDETIKAHIENINDFYRDIANDKIRYERYKERYQQIKSGEYVVTQDEHNKAISIIKEAYPECQSDELATKQLQKTLRIHFSDISMGLRGIHRRNYFLHLLTFQTPFFINKIIYKK
jgi:Lhr-like helicase